ncbi:MATE family efflux transporter [Paenibacillus curdlanolyticus]|nr:MATE family efflux transporter [Paenibacillus curdlanolyticus]
MSIASKTSHSPSREMSLFHLTWPIFLEVLLFMLMGIADTLMLSALSDNAVSGVGTANQYISIAMLILEVIGNGASIVVAQYIGAKSYEAAARISALSVTLSMAVGLVISAFFFLLNVQLMEAMNLHGETLDYAVSYIAIVGSSLFLQAVINAVAAIVRVHGFTKEAMLVSLGMNIVHIIGNYMLIFGKLGAPEMGVEGAAISSVISRALAIVVFFWLMYRIMRVRIMLQYYWSLSKEYIGKILKIGVPAAMESVMYQGCQMVFLYYATFLGDHALAARQYVQNISWFIYLFGYSCGLGTAIIVGRLIGANRQDEAYARVWRSIRSVVVITLIGIVLAVIFRYPIMGMFTNNDDILELGAHLMLYTIALETGRMGNLVLVNSLRASGDAKFPFWVGAVTMVGMSLPLGYLLVFQLDMGLPGIWLAVAADEWIRTIIMWFRWKSRKWERYGLVKQGVVEGQPAGTSTGA